MNKNLTDSFTRDLIALALFKKQYFETIVPHLKDNFLPDEDYQQIWIQTKRHYHKTNRVPTLPVLIQFFDSRNKKDKYDRIIDLLIEIKTVEKPNEEDVFSGFEFFIKQKQFVEFYNEMGEAFNNGQREDAFGIFQKSAEEFTNFSLDSTHFERVFGDFDKRNLERTLAAMEQKLKQIPTGFDFIDKSTSGGHWQGEIELWLGDSGVGKTKLLCSRGVASARRGFNVLHVQAEGTTDQCTTNYDACWTGFRYLDIKLNRIEGGKVNARSKIARTLLKKGGGEIFIKSVEEFGTLAIQQIRTWIFELRALGIIIDHLVIDYLSLLEISGEKFPNTQEGSRMRILKLGQLMKNLCIEFGILGTTAAQANSVDPELMKQPDFVLTRFNIGQAKRMVEPFSYFYTINQTPDEKRSQVVRVYEDKMREHWGGKTHTIKQSLGNSRFYDRIGTKNMVLEDDEDMMEE